MVVLKEDMTPEQMETQAREILEEATRKRAELAAQAKQSKRTKKPMESIDFEYEFSAIDKKQNEGLDKLDLILQELSYKPDSQKQVVGGVLPQSQSLDKNSHPAYDPFSEIEPERSGYKDFGIKEKKPLSMGTKVAVFIAIFAVLGALILIAIGVL